MFKTVLKKDLPPGTKTIDSVWAMKKKNSSTLRGRLNVRGFKQIEGQHYNGTTISSPVTNSATIRIVLVLMVMASMIAGCQGSILTWRIQGQGKSAYGNPTWL